MRVKTTAKTALIALASYLGVYSLLAAFGGYRFDQSGRIRYVTGLSVSDIEMWHPAIAWYQSDFEKYDGRIVTRGNMLGYAFSPLIRLDRALIHKTRIIEPVRNAAERRDAE
jgi:hypothetical protein